MLEQAKENRKAVGIEEETGVALAKRQGLLDLRKRLFLFILMCNFA